jgi:hypothetical protein
MPSCRRRDRCLEPDETPRRSLTRTAAVARIGRTEVVSRSALEAPEPGGGGVVREGAA